MIEGSRSIETYIENLRAGKVTNGQRTNDIQDKTVKKNAKRARKALQLGAVAYKDVCLRRSHLTVWLDDATVMDKPYHVHYDMNCEILEHLLADINRLDVRFNDEMDLEIQRQ